MKPCPPQQPLGGHVEYGYRVKDREYQECSGWAKLWFRLHPQSKYWPSALAGVYLADAIDYRLKNEGCTDVPDPVQTCTAPAQAEQRGRVVIGPVGPSGVDMRSAPGGTVRFAPLDPELSFLTLPDTIRDAARTPIHCENLNHMGSADGAWTLPVMGEIRPFGRRPCGDPDNPGTACVSPTVCLDAVGNRQRDCVRHADRYAVIPFAGSDRVTYNTNGGDVTTDLRWEVCCGCGEPPAGPPPTFDQGPCGDPNVQRGLMQVAVDTSAALRAEIKPHYERFEFEKHQAEQWRGDFETVSNSCAGWDIAVTLTEALFGGVGAAEGLGPTEGAQAFSKLTSIVRAVLEQDPTIPLTSFLGAAEELEVAGQTALEVKLLGVEGFTAGGVIDTVSTVAGGALEFLRAGEIEQQRAHLEDCTDTPLVAGVTFDGAREYLDHAEAAVRELTAVLPLMTRLEQSDTDVYNRWHAFHQACLQYAECKGLDPAVCNPPPP